MTSISSSAPTTGSMVITFSWTASFFLSFSAFFLSLSWIPSSAVIVWRMCKRLVLDPSMKFFTAISLAHLSSFFFNVEIALSISLIVDSISWVVFAALTIERICFTGLVNLSLKLSPLTFLVVSWIVM
ncbi:hypothetical protein D3C74_354110 [compost metagenome]